MNLHILEKMQTNSWNQLTFLMRRHIFKKVIMMSKHTIIFIVHSPNVKNLIFPIIGRIYVVIQKCKQITIFFKQICISQFMTKIFLTLHFLRKNVNKQLKSADFFSQTSKFWKISLKKVLAFFALMSKHTSLLQINLHNRHNG